MVLVVAGLERNHRRALRTPSAGQAVSENRDLNRCLQEMRACDRTDAEKPTSRRRDVGGAALSPAGRRVKYDPGANLVVPRRG